MATTAVFNDVQRETLEALCETFVPAVEVDTLDPVEAGVHAPLGRGHARARADRGACWPRR